MLVSIASRQKLSSLVDGIPQYPVYRGSVASNGIKSSDLKTGLLGMKPQSVDERDGFKLVFGDGWLLVRPSGTEPKIRITSEARSEARAHELYDGAVEAISAIQRD